MQTSFPKLILHRMQTGLESIGVWTQARRRVHRRCTQSGLCLITMLVLFHGLEGSSASHYSEAFADFARERHLGFAIPHFRGCSGELNWAPRAYHSGDYEEIGWLLQRFRATHRGRIVAVGVSLGGNALLRWAQESGLQWQAPSLPAVTGSLSLVGLLRD